VLCLGYLPEPDSAQIVALHIKAAVGLGKKLVVQTGCAELADDPHLKELGRDQALFVKFLPHDWLFAHAAAVIHHGGMGVTAAALRSGCPMLVEPYDKDQLFNAALGRSLGVCSVMNPRQLTVEGIARVLSERVGSPEAWERARVCRAKIIVEDGIGTAFGRVESLLCAPVPRLEDRQPVFLGITELEEE
jgi:UDP:flavonoid glycosyltransferase YjiC (YdhE family)